MHLTQDQLNLMLTGDAAPADQAAWADHVLDCPACARAFKAGHALHREMAPAARPAAKQLRYALGVAAVMAMCVAPYLRREPAAVDLGPAAQVAAAEPAPELTPDLPALAVRDRIRAVNYGRALESWGSETNLTRLVALSGR